MTQSSVCNRLEINRAKSQPNELNDQNERKKDKKIIQPFHSKRKKRVMKSKSKTDYLKCKHRNLDQDEKEDFIQKNKKQIRKRALSQRICLAEQTKVKLAKLKPIKRKLFEKKANFNIFKDSPDGSKSGSVRSLKKTYLLRKNSQHKSKLYKSQNFSNFRSASVVLPKKKQKEKSISSRLKPKKGKKKIKIKIKNSKKDAVKMKKKKKAKTGRKKLFRSKTKVDEKFFSQKVKFSSNLFDKSESIDWGKGLAGNYQTEQFGRNDMSIFNSEIFKKKLKSIDRKKKGAKMSKKKKIKKANPTKKLTKPGNIIKGSASLTNSGLFEKKNLLDSRISLKNKKQRKKKKIKKNKKTKKRKTKEEKDLSKNRIQKSEKKRKLSFSQTSKNLGSQKAKDEFHILKKIENKKHKSKRRTKRKKAKPMQPNFQKKHGSNFKKKKKNKQYVTVETKNYEIPTEFDLASYRQSHSISKQSSSSSMNSQQTQKAFKQSSILPKDPNFDLKIKNEIFRTQNDTISLGSDLDFQNPDCETGPELSERELNVKCSNESGSQKMVNFDSNMMSGAHRMAPKYFGSESGLIETSEEANYYNNPSIMITDSRASNQEPELNFEYNTGVGGSDARNQEANDLQIEIMESQEFESNQNNTGHLKKIFTFKESSSGKNKVSKNEDGKEYNSLPGKRFSFANQGQGVALQPHTLDIQIPDYTRSEKRNFFEEDENYQGSSKESQQDYFVTPETVGNVKSGLFFKNEETEDGDSSHNQISNKNVFDNSLKDSIAEDESHNKKSGESPQNNVEESADHVTNTRTENRSKTQPINEMPKSTGPKFVIQNSEFMNSNSHSSEEEESNNGLDFEIDIVDCDDEDTSNGKPKVLIWSPESEESSYMSNSLSKFNKSVNLEKNIFSMTILECSNSEDRYASRGSIKSSG